MDRNRRSPKRFGRLLYGLGTLLALGALALGVLSTPWFQHMIERRVIASFENLTGGRVEIGAFHFRPVTLQLVFKNLVIRGSEPRGTPPLLSARTVVARFRLVPLLHRQVRLASLDGEDAEIHLRTNPDGSTNLPGPAVRPPPDQALEQLMNLSIGRLTLAHSRFFWNDEQLPVDLNAQEVAVLLRPERGRRYVGSLSSSATTIRSPRWSPPAITFTGQFELSRAGLDVTSLTWQVQGMTGQASFSLRHAPKRAASFSFQADVEVPPLARILQLPELRAGSVRVEGQGSYRAGQWFVQGRTQARQLLIKGPEFNPGPVDASADYRLDQGRVVLSNLRGAGLGGTAQGKAEVALNGSTPRFHLYTQLHSLDLAAVFRSFSPTSMLISHLRPSSRIDGTAEASWNGRLENFRSEFSLLFRAPEAAPKSSLPVSGRARGRIEQARVLDLELKEAAFETPHSSLTARGILSESAASSAPARSLAFAVTSSDFDEWRPLVEFYSGASEPMPLSLKSSATFSGEVSGPIMQPNIRGRLEVGEFEYHGWTWDKLTANAALSRNFAEISSGRLEHETSSVSLTASAQLEDWRVTPDSAVHLAAQAQRTPLEGLKAALGAEYPVSGYVTGRLDLDGTPSNLAGTGTLRIENGTISQESFDSFRGHIRVTESIWNLKALELAKGHGRVTGQMSFEPSKRFVSAQLRGTGFLLGEFKCLTLPGTASTPSQGFDGRASFDVRGGGTPEHLQVHSTWSVQEISLAGNPIGNFRGQLDGQGPRLSLQGDASGPSGTLRLSGEARAADDWPVALEGEYTNFRMDPWIRLLLNGKLNAPVTASGSFKLTGPLRDPAHMELRSQTQTLEVSFSELNWKNDRPIDLQYTSRVLTASRFLMRGPSTELEVGGSVRFAENAALSLDAQGTASASLLSLLDPRLQATGGSQLKLRVTGNPAQPILNGTLEVQDVSLSYGDLPFRFSGLKGVIQLEGERAVVRSLRGVSGGGAVSLGGFMTLASAPRFDLQADLDQVRVPYPANFTSLLSGNLRLSGTPERAQLQGELVLRQIFVQENINWLARIIKAGGPLAEQTPRVSSPLASKIRLNVRVTASPPVRLETQDLRLIGDLDVRLQGTLANPVQVGTIHFLSGEAVFRGNRFRLNRGDISLTNPFRTQAVLDVEAQTRVQRYELTLDISGPFDRLKLAYRSDPPLPTADILSLLALGYSRQQEEMSISAGHPLPSVGASALLSEALSSQVTGRIQRLFGVSRIKIDPNVGAPGFGSGARVTVEQQVTRDFTLTYVTNTAASQYRIIQFEWTVSDNVSLIGVRDQNGIFGLEFKFQQRFK